MAGGVAGAIVETGIVGANTLAMAASSTISSGGYYALTGGKGNISTSIGGIGINWTDASVTLANPFDDDPFLQNALEFGQWYSFLGDAVGAYGTVQTNRLKRELGEMYESYEFAKKMDRLNSEPNPFGSNTWYGNFVGPGDAAPRELLHHMGPRDPVDAVAQIHDKAYQQAPGLSGGGYKALFDHNVIQADLKATIGFAQAGFRGEYYLDSNLLGGLWAFSASGLFAVLSAAKISAYLAPYSTIIEE